MMENNTAAECKDEIGECPSCEGEGEVFVGYSGAPDDDGLGRCGHCGGNGKEPTPDEVADLRYSAEGSYFEAKHYKEESEYHARIIQACRDTMTDDQWKAVMGRLSDEDRKIQEMRDLYA